MSLLSVDIIGYMLCFINNPYDLCSACLVNRDWHVAATQDQIWNNMMNKAWFLPHPFSGAGGRVQSEIFGHFEVPAELNQTRGDLALGLQGRAAFSHLVETKACLSCGYHTETMMEFYYANDRGLVRLCDLCSEDDCMRHANANKQIRDYRERTGFMEFPDAKKRYMLTERECGHAPMNSFYFPRCVFLRMAMDKYGGLDGIKQEWKRRKECKKQAALKAQELKKRKCAFDDGSQSKRIKTL
jgi:hypothetical protein